jgi:subtilisin family serine protease
MSLDGISRARLIQLITLLTLVVTCTSFLAISSAFAAPLQPSTLLPSPSLAHPGEEPEGERQPARRIPGSYIVVFKDSVEHPSNLADAQTEAPGRDLGLVYRHALKGYSAELPTTAVEALRANPQIKYVVPDHKVEVFAQTVPTGIERTSDTQNETAAIDGVDTRVNADVAVIDTGIDYTQPDLNVYKRADCVPASQGAPVECIEGAGTDGFGHGTHVAGTIGAIDNGSGVVGVAPGVRLWAVRALNSEGRGQESWILAAMDWVTAHASEIEVANMSLGGGYGGGKDPLTEALETSVNAGVVYVVSAGNEAEDVKYVSPARAPAAITVGALADYDGKPGAKSGTTCRQEVGADDTMATFSNYGEGVDLVAPGVCIYSTLPMGGSIFGKEYGYLSGTSMAAPHVAGAAALLASKSNPNSRADVESIRNQLVEAGSLNYSDTTPEPPSPLLYLGKDQLEPEVITGGTSSLTAFSATLTGGVAPKGIETEYKFEYGPTSSYGTVKPVPSGAIKAGAGYTRVSQAISGLESGVQYHFRLVTSNKEGTRTGKDETFTPYIDTVTTTATELGETKATLNGVQYLGDWPKGEPTEYKFEYGQTKAYGSKVSASEVKEFEDCEYECPEEQEVFGSQWAHALKPLTGLAKETKYHYRMVASNSLGTFTAGDQAFRTELWPKWTVSGEFKRELASIACSAVNVCMGIGGIHESESWNGTTAKTATYALNYPQGNNESLLDVSCVSATDCTAVGREGACAYGTECTKALLPMIMRWNGEKWTKQSVPALPGGSEEGYLKAVECTSATWCIAVGQYTKIEAGKPKWEYASMLWNGENWTFQALPKASYVEAPFSAPDITLNDVSCTSTSNCTAVGYETMHWNGSSWSSMAMPFPNVTLTSVSCSSPSACMAVGFSAFGEESAEEGAARRWDGKEWSVVHMGDLAKPGREARVDNVSCAAAWSCVAVGWGSGRSVWDQNPFVTRWDGKEWAVEALEVGANLHGVDCESTSHCTVVGSTGTIETSDFAVPVPKPTVTTEAATAISQTEATLRAAVNTNNQPTSYFFEYGTTTGYGSKAPVPSAEAGFSQSPITVSQVINGLTANTTYHYRVVAQSEAGTAQSGDMTFTTLPPCKGGGGKCEWKSQTTPDFTTSSYNLSGVSCASATLCLAAGTDKLKAKPRAELWNGSAWSNMSWASTQATGATDIACGSTTTCMVVGGTEIGASEERVMAWSFKEEGGNWLKPGKTLPVPSGASRLILRSVSCSSATACTAVGSYYLATEKVFKPLVERWDGTSWALQTAPNPPSGGSETAMMGVSCASATSCVTVGTTGTLTVAESWNGTSWSLMTTPSPGTGESILEGISCNSSSACIATGLYKETGTGQHQKPLAERWNGAAWSVLSVPSPVGAEGDVTLKEVSCATTSYCTAVGKYSPIKEIGSESKTLTEYWDGAKWTVQASPNSSLKGNALTAVSCSSTIACTAVGNAQIVPGERFGEVSLAERYE